MVGFFISAARTNAWLVALGTLLNRFLETLLYLFALVYAVGLTGIWPPSNTTSKSVTLRVILMFYLVTIYSDPQHLVARISSYVHPDRTFLYYYWIWDRTHTPLFNEEV